jgi:uncharacterized protein (TIGR03437 family)
MTALDQAMQTALSQNSLAGGSLAVSYNGILVFARGYGCADQTSNTPVQPDSLFRFASVSKTFTAVGIMQLAQQGKLALNASVFGSILTDYTPLPGKTLNPELLQITVEDLLQMTGGWDRSTTQYFNGVPYSEPLDGLLAAAAEATGHAQPATDADVITVMLSQPLQHTPGTYYAYSDFGYCLLGRVIEQVSGIGYEQYVQQNILKPLGIGRQKLGATMQSDTVNGEVIYYDVPGAALVTSVFPFVTAPVPAPYGGHFMEDVDSTGEWVSTTVDLTRFLNGIVGIGGGTALLNAMSIARMQVFPTSVQNETATSFYGLGFDMDSVSGGFRWSKDGALTGTLSYVVLNQVSGITWAVVFNGNPADPNFEGDISSQVISILTQVLSSKAFPKDNLYSNFQSTLLTPTFSTTVPPVVNAAINQPGIVSASWVAINGQNLATATRTWWADEVVGSILPVEIDHVRVTINGKNAVVYYVSPNQLFVQAPTDSTLGPVNVQVTRDGTVSAVIQATYIANSGVGPPPAQFPQAIIFSAFNSSPVWGALLISATASSGLQVGFTSNTPSVCGLTGSTVTVIGAGTCSITATQPGSAAYLAAAPVTQTFAAAPAFFTGEVNLGSGVYYLQFPDNNLFGYYNFVTGAIYYHYDMGYEAFIPGSAADIYLFDFASGHWFYTSSTLFPYLYDFTLKAWLYYLPDTKNPGHYTSNPRYFSNLTTGKILTM